MGKTKQHLLRKFYIAGSQMWFDPKNHLDKKLRGFGCGVIALHDLNVYRGEMTDPKSRSEYKDQIRRMEKRGMFVFPRLGIAPYYYPLMCNLFQIRHGLKMRVGWGHTAGYEYRHGAKDIKKCLDANCPVVFSVGPTYPFLFKKKYLTLYDMERKPSGWKTKAHYMTVLGTAEADGELWLEVASWGKQYSIRFDELAEFSRLTVPFSTRFYRIYEKR